MRSNTDEGIICSPPRQFSSTERQGAGMRTVCVCVCVCACVRVCVRAEMKMTPRLNTGSAISTTLNCPQLGSLVSYISQYK